MSEILKFYKDRSERIKSYISHKDRFKQVMVDLTKLDYEYNFDMLGRPIIQMPQDIVAYQEVVWRTKPDLIIETGIAHGGSLILSASLLTLLEYEDAVRLGAVVDPKIPKRMVLGIDIDIRKHNEEQINMHPMSSRIKMIQGSSVDSKIADLVREYSKNFKKILVCLDSNHTHDHVLQELNYYAGLVSPGSYCIIFDTNVEDLPDDAIIDRPWRVGNNPKTAVIEFLNHNNDFEVDEEFDNKLLISVAPMGYLKRK